MAICSLASLREDDAGSRLTVTGLLGDGISSKLRTSEVVPNDGRSL